MSTASATGTPESTPPATKELDYVAQKECGCIVGWCSVHLSRRELAKETGDWIRRGFSVVRMSTEEARTRLQECRCGQPPLAEPPRQEVLF